MTRADRRRPRGLWMQGCSKPIQTSRTVTTQDASLHGEVRKIFSIEFLSCILARVGKGRVTKL
eukprot:scaffold57121_cov16-Tisochrysis_lutea.AAC.1